MRRAALLLALTMAGLSGCAALSMKRQPDARAQLNQGVAALEAQDYAGARALLEPLYREHWQDGVGQQAMLALIAADLDNRNPDRRLWAAAEMAARLLSIPELEPWLIPVGESYYLLALELGAQEERVARADAARAAAEAEVAAAERELPASAAESVPVRINRITTERDGLLRRVSELEEQAEARDKELRDTKQELERVKQTIRH
jgi:vacuolar-type H+-ATPase subunit I/STV1